MTAGASAARAGRSGMAIGSHSVRILTLSWEYPPIVEGGLARHVRKLSEQLVRDGHEVHVVTRGGGRLEAVEDRHGVIVHRVREPEFPKDDLDAFIAWVDHMNEDMLRRGRGARRRLRPRPLARLARRGRGAARSRAGAGVPWLVTVHATEYGRHQGWVDKHPQSHIHGVERRMARGADHVITCSHFMREQVADVFGVPRERDHARSRTASTRPTCSPSPTCRGCARASPRPTRSSSCSSAGSSTRRASTSRSTRCPG